MEISESPTTAQRQGVTGKVTHELLHPLELNDSLAFEMIETVTLEFLEKEPSFRFRSWFERKFRSESVVGNYTGNHRNFSCALY